MTEPETSELEPRPGTLAWLERQDHVDVLGLQLPACHRIPDGSTLAEGNGHCRLVKPDGQRCPAPATRRYGICLVHSGGGGFADPFAASQAGHAAKVKMRERRTLLGIGANRVGNPRSHARLRALERAESLAEALVDAPLDDPEISALARQIAAVRALDATFPLQQASIELELPAQADQVEGMSWENMRQLAARLLEDELNPS